MPKKKATEIYKGYKEKIDEFMNTKTTATFVNDEEAKTNNDKLDEKWAKLNAGGHSIVTIRGGLTEISGIQNKGLDRVSLFRTQAAGCLFVVLCW